MTKKPSPGRIVALLLLVVLALSGVADAAPLTGGNTIYVINGEEKSFLFDPIQRADGHLLSEEVFDHLDLTRTAVSGTVTVRRAGIIVAMTLGETEAKLNHEPYVLTPAPIRIGGRLFLPLNILPELGYDVTVDGGFVQIRDIARHMPPDPGWDVAEWSRQMQLKTVRGTVRGDDQQAYLDLEAIYLTPELVASRHFAASFGQRAKLLDQMKVGSLLLVRATNQSGRSTTLKPASLMLYDENRRQYNLHAELNHQGLISQPIASGAVKSVVLVYERIPETIERVTLFAATSHNHLGAFHLNR